MKVKKLKQGQMFKYAGYGWIKLEQEGLALMKDILEERRFDENCNDWRKSELGEYLNDDFYEHLKKNGAKDSDFQLIETDLTADDGMKDYGTIEDFVSLMTADLYRRNRHLLKLLESWWWLATPHSCLASNSYFVRCVDSSGTLGSGYAYSDDFGVRPLIKLHNNTEVLVDDVTEIDTNTTELIKQWAIERGVDKAKPEKQFLKVIEEVGELAEGMAKGRPEQVKDSIGDVYVTLVILSMQLGHDIEDCIKIAYDEIKSRKGEMVNGVFVKESDLH